MKRFENKYFGIGLIIMAVFSSNIPIPARAQEDKLYVGWATADITPDKPVNLIGQFHKRITMKVNDPLTATVLALETRDDNKRNEQAIMVSCDVAFTRAQTQKKLQSLISLKLPDFDASKLFLNATHTHTAPGFIDDEFFGLYDTSNDKGVMKPSEFESLFLNRVAEAVVKAWEGRKPAGYSWGLGNAVLSHNRRTVKIDGTARMYGSQDADFAAYEGNEDNKVQMLFFWDEDKSLTGIVINTVVTAQVTENADFISADFYHEARENIKNKYGKEISVFIQVSSGGDVEPESNESVYKRAEEMMLRMKGMTARQELADRLFKAVEEVMPYVKKEIKDKVVFKHTVAKVELPVKEPPAPPFYITDDVKPAELHIIRLDDIAIATNPFELFMDYGTLIKVRSKALLTFLVSLSCQHSGYLPTERAVKGGGYSADKYLVGPEGGYKLVDETVKLINEMWE